MVDIARDGAASSGPVIDPDADRPAGPSSEGGAGNALRLVAAIGSPIALVTSLLFYFGWVRASVQARTLGYDTAILDWSIQDYILRSILVLFLPLMVLLVLMLLLLGLHRRLVVPMVESPRLGGVSTWLPRGLRASWIFWALAAIAVLLLDAPLSGAALPLGFTFALLCAMYGDVLERRITGKARTSATAKALILVLLAFSVFWDVERLARVMGEGYAEQIIADPRQLLSVTIYSPKSLEIRASGVVETKLGGAESAYRYRYDGLRLVQRSGDRYLLMGELWDSHSSRIIVVRDTDAIRMEFARSHP
jgi:hypothetical protein